MVGLFDAFQSHINSYVPRIFTVRDLISSPNIEFREEILDHLDAFHNAEGSSSQDAHRHQTRDR